MKEVAAVLTERSCVKAIKSKCTMYQGRSKSAAVRYEEEMT